MKKKLRRQWTADDDVMLRELGPKVSLARLAIRLQRTVLSVADRARLLGVPLYRPAKASGRCDPRYRAFTHI